MTPTEEPMARCGERGCKVPHPVRPWVDRPLARRLAVPEPDRRPEWLRRLPARDMTGALR